MHICDRENVRVLLPPFGDDALDLVELFCCHSAPGEVSRLHLEAPLCVLERHRCACRNDR